MRLVAKPGGTKQQFRAMLFSQPFDLAWATVVSVIKSPMWVDEVQVALSGAEEVQVAFSGPEEIQF